MAYKMKGMDFGNKSILPKDNKTVAKMKLKKAKIKAINKLKKSGEWTQEKEDEINQYTDY
tara:strand:+ start:628 stop:807 length:180 start_codon:yes stop_codon:yes gene_type:complete